MAEDDKIPILSREHLIATFIKASQNLVDSDSRDFLEEFHNHPEAWAACLNLVQHEDEGVAMMAAIIMYDKLPTDPRVSSDDKRESLARILFGNSYNLHKKVISKLSQTYATLIVRKEKYLIELAKQVRSFDESKIVVLIEVFREVAGEFQNAFLALKTKVQVEKDLEKLKPVLIELICWSANQNINLLQSSLLCLESWQKAKIQFSFSELSKNDLHLTLLNYLSSQESSNPTSSNPALFGTICNCIANTFTEKNPPPDDLISQVFKHLILIQQRLTANAFDIEFFKFACDFTSIICSKLYGRLFRGEFREWGDQVTQVVMNYAQNPDPNISEITFDLWMRLEDKEAPRARLAPIFNGPVQKELLTILLNRAYGNNVEPEKVAHFRGVVEEFVPLIYDFLGNQFLEQVVTTIVEHQSNWTLIESSCWAMCCIWGDLPLENNNVASFLEEHWRPFCIQILKEHALPTQLHHTILKLLQTSIHWISKDQNTWQLALAFSLNSCSANTLGLEAGRTFKKICLASVDEFRKNTDTFGELMHGTLQQMNQGVDGETDSLELYFSSLAIVSDNISSDNPTFGLKFFDTLTKPMLQKMLSGNFSAINLRLIQCVLKEVTCHKLTEHNEAELWATQIFNALTSLTSNFRPSAKTEENDVFWDLICENVKSLLRLFPNVIERNFQAFVGIIQKAGYEFAIPLLETSFSTFIKDEQLHENYANFTLGIINGVREFNVEQMRRKGALIQRLYQLLHTFKNDLRADCFSQLLEPTIFLAFHVLEGVADPSVLRRVLSTMNKILKKRKLLRKWFEQSGTNFEEVLKHCLELVCYTIPDGLVQSGAGVLHGFLEIGDYKGNRATEMLTKCLGQILLEKSVEIDQKQFDVLRHAFEVVQKKERRFKSLVQDLAAILRGGDDWDVIASYEFENVPSAKVVHISLD